MKHEIAKLDGLLLEAAVALAEGHSIKKHPDPTFAGAWLDLTTGEIVEHYAQWWGAGGEIIERERISLDDPDRTRTDQWRATVWGTLLTREQGGNDGASALGPTPLIAAMRAYVVSKLGDEVDLP